MVDGAAAPVKTGWVDTLKAKLNLESILKNKDQLIMLLLYLGAGFFAGFLIKRFFKYFVALAIFVAVIWLLEYSGIIHIMIDWGKASETLGIKAVPAMDETLISGYWQWVKANWMVSVSAVVGFIIGWKVS